PCGITVGDHTGTDLGEVTEAERLHPIKKTLVFHREQGKIAIVADELHVRHVRTGILVPPDQDLLVPANDMRIGHDALAFLGLNDKSRAPRPPDRVETPGRVPDRLLTERADLD